MNNTVNKTNIKNSDLNFLASAANLKVEAMHLTHKKTFGQRAADRITRIVGSWTFIIIQSAFLVVWITLNVVAWQKHWDPYPFILLNLMLSFQAAYTAPIILMSENMEAERDRFKAEKDFATNRKAEKEIEETQGRLENIEKNLVKVIELLEKK